MNLNNDQHWNGATQAAKQQCSPFMYLNLLKLTLEPCSDIGTAGVWRIQAINDAGGWKDRTTVEDMDLAVRAGLGGWKFVYVGNVKVFLPK